MKSLISLNYIRNRLIVEWNLESLDVISQTNAKYFCTAYGKVFGWLLGNLILKNLDYKTPDILLESCALPEVSHGIVNHIIIPYRGSSTHIPGKRVFLKNVQTRIRICREENEQKALSWYAGFGEATPPTQQTASQTLPPHVTSPSKQRRVSNIITLGSWKMCDTWPARNSSYTAADLQKVVAKAALTA